LNPTPLDFSPIVHETITQQFTAWFTPLLRRAAEEYQPSTWQPGATTTSSGVRVVVESIEPGWQQTLQVPTVFQWQTDNSRDADSVRPLLGVLAISMKLTTNVVFTITGDHPETLPEDVEYNDIGFDSLVTVLFRCDENRPGTSTIQDVRVTQLELLGAAGETDIAGLNDVFVASKHPPVADKLVDFVNTNIQSFLNEMMPAVIQQAFALGKSSGSGLLPLPICAETAPTGVVVSGSKRYRPLASFNYLSRATYVCSPDQLLYCVQQTSVVYKEKVAEVFCARYCTATKNGISLQQCADLCTATTSCAAFDFQRPLRGDPQGQWPEETSHCWIYSTDKVGPDDRPQFSTTYPITSYQPIKDNLIMVPGYPTPLRVRFDTASVHFKQVAPKLRSLVDLAIVCHPPPCTSFDMYDDPTLGNRETGRSYNLSWTKDGTMFAAGVRHYTWPVS
jgi:hypothetical protein